MRVEITTVCKIEPNEYSSMNMLMGRAYESGRKNKEDTYIEALKSNHELIESMVQDAFDAGRKYGIDKT